MSVGSCDRYTGAHAEGVSRHPVSLLWLAISLFCIYWGCDARGSVSGISKDWCLLPPLTYHDLRTARAPTFLSLLWTLREFPGCFMDEPCKMLDLADSPLQLPQCGLGECVHMCVVN